MTFLKRPFVITLGLPISFHCLVYTPLTCLHEAPFPSHTPHLSIFSSDSKTWLQPAAWNEKKRKWPFISVHMCLNSLKSVTNIKVFCQYCCCDDLLLCSLKSRCANIKTNFDVLKLTVIALVCIRYVQKSGFSLILYCLSLFNPLIVLSSQNANAKYLNSLPCKRRWCRHRKWKGLFCIWYRLQRFHIPLPSTLFYNTICMDLRMTRKGVGNKWMMWF